MATKVTEATAEADALRRLVKLKTRELKNVRRLAQEVLLQRSDVETFLLSSLHIARREVERESIKPRSRPGSGSNGGGGGGGGGGEAVGSMDIKDLPWEDRERILRLLFAKINNQAAQAYFGNLPQHPLGSEPSQQALSGLHTKGGPAGIV